MNTLNSHQIQKIEQLAQEAQRDPQAYRRKVIALAWLGYAYFGLLAGGALGLGGVTIYAVVSGHKAWLLYLLAKFIWAPFALVILLGRVFFLRLQPPQGRVIDAKDFPELFAEIDDIRAQLQAQPIYQVVISHEFNAAVASLPRFGVLGWPRHYLLLGLPLLQQLDRASLRAVLAHEFGHLSRTHTRTGHWIYRLRLSWELILQQLQLQRSWGLWLVRPFLRWYAPFFNAYSFVFARNNEYEADRCAVQVAGAAALARALSTLQALSEREQQFWQQLGQRARHEAEPPKQILHELKQVLSQLSTSQRWACIQHGMQEVTAYHDTHPSLADRLSAAQAQPQLNPVDDCTNAAAELLGANGEDLQAQIERDWHQQWQTVWQEEYRDGRKRQEQLEQLERKAATTELSADEEFQYGQCLLELHREADQSTAKPWHEHPAIPHLRRALAIEPEHADALFALGQFLATNHDAECETLLQRARLHKPLLRLACAELLLNFAIQHHPQTIHGEYLEEFEAAQFEMQQAQIERNQVTTKDRFLDHGLTPEACAHFCQLIQAQPNIQGAYLLRKAVNIYAELPCYVLVLKSKEPHTAYAGMINQLSDDLEDASLIVFTERDSKELFRKLKKIKGAKLFETQKRWWA